MSADIHTKILASGGSTSYRRPQSEYFQPSSLELHSNASQALQYIHHKSGYHFPKAVFMQQISREINGDGILTANGTLNYSVAAGR